MKYLVRLAVLLALFVGGPAFADIGPANRYVPDASLVGKGRLKVLTFKIFDAELYAPGGRWSSSKPFALKLKYLRRFSGNSIAKRSVEEMRRQGFRNKAKLDRWYKRMDAIFPNVRPDMSIVGVRDANGHAVFYSGSRRLGAIADREFSRRFFNIWLGGNTRSPSLRNRLVGRG
ncbi:MAG: chalcone isomerase family protein [Pseudomonadota bacterium]